MRVVNGSSCTTEPSFSREDRAHKQTNKQTSNNTTYIHNRINKCLSDTKNGRRLMTSKDIFVFVQSTSPCDGLSQPSTLQPYTNPPPKHYQQPSQAFTQTQPRRVLLSIPTRRSSRICNGSWYGSWYIPSNEDFVMLIARRKPKSRHASVQWNDYVPRKIYTTPFKRVSKSFQDNGDGRLMMLWNMSKF